ncbi:LysR family transcriptional regulator [Vibrio coralliilyticus]|uniref:LysR family transcriptional regulator n=1 Tax=Vibrio coralliilyticus TaxID=190893 RepID=UPI000BAC1E6A|nr:LysR family transcriptional regulator [Vibrio coralliilyticus]NOI76024.1 LysR family transcriptional regulator [Vibrio coralliilyticus]PAW03938.1 LysR family transcriptional regulator [Vibrio coralliilyticus]
MAKKHNQFSEFGNNKHSRLNWDDARVFLAIARAGTLSGASKTLRIGIATATRRLERLENALELRLFVRDQLGYKLTDEGLSLIPQAEALEQAGYAFGSAAQGTDDGVSGHVRLATAQGLADHLIIPALPNLLSKHDGLNVEVETSVSTVNLHRRDADMAIRMIRPERGNVTIRRLGDLGFGLYGSESYLNRRPRSKQTNPYVNDDFIGWTETQQHLPAAQWIQKTLRGRTCKLTTSSLSAQFSAVHAGLGLSILPHFIAKQQGLICIENEVGCNQPIWLAIHSDLAHSRRIRVVADFLSELIYENQESLEFGK